MTGPYDQAKDYKTVMPLDGVTLWLIGEDADDAKGSMLWDSFEGAEESARENGGLKVYSVLARIDFSTMELEEDTADPEDRS